MAIEPEPALEHGWRRPALAHGARGKEAKLSELGHVAMRPCGHALTEKRHGLVVDGLVSRARGHAERRSAEVMVMRRRDRRRRITPGADKADDAADQPRGSLAGFRLRLQVARDTSGRRSNSAEKPAVSAGYQASMKARKRLDEVFARVKGIAGPAKTRPRGRDRVGGRFTLALAADNPLRRAKLLEAGP